MLFVSMLIIIIIIIITVGIASEVVTVLEVNSNM